MGVTFRESNFEKRAPEFPTEEASMKRARLVQIAGLLAVNGDAGRGGNSRRTDGSSAEIHENHRHAFLCCQA
jgi:hypothetical protein